MTASPLAAGIEGAPVQPRRSWLPVWNAVAISILWLVTTVVLAIWVAGGGIQSLGEGGGETLTGMGRLAGLLAAAVMLFQVLLMARVPVFERGIGHDAIVRWHRWLGFATFWLMTAHIGLIVAGYAATAASTPLATLRDMVANYPGMLLATAGTLLVAIAVVAFSIKRVRRRLRYENWHLLHLYAYLGVALAIPHMVWNGNDFLGSWSATIFWWTLWGVVFLAVLVFRILVPVWRSMRCQLRVAEVAIDGSRGIFVRMIGRGLSRLRTRPGQFFVWRFRDGPGWTRGHPFSIANAPTDTELDLAVRVVGDGTARMAEMPPGTRVLFEGPFGRLTGEKRATPGLLLLGAGAGVAPLVSLLQGEPWAPGEATLITRDNSPEEAMLRPEIDALVRERGLVWHGLYGLPTSPNPTWLPGDWPEGGGRRVLSGVVGDGKGHDVYLCGPEPWMAGVAAELQAVGVPRARIHSESFAM